MTRTAFCRKSPRVPRVCWLGSWALGTSDRGGQDKANCRSRLPSVARVVCTLVLDNSVWRLQGAATPLSTRSPLFSGVQTPSLAMCGERETAALALTQVILRFSTTAAFSSCWASFDFRSSSDGEQRRRLSHPSRQGPRSRWRTPERTRDWQGTPPPDELPRCGSSGHTSGGGQSPASP